VLRPIYNRLPQTLQRANRAIRKRLKAQPGPPSEHAHLAGRLALTAHDAPPSPAEAVGFQRAYHDFRPDVVIADYAWMAPLLDEIPAEDVVVKVILTKDVLHRRVADFARMGVDSGHAEWTRAAESALLCKAQLLVAIQSEEAKLLRQMVPEAEVVCAPFAVRPRPTRDHQVAGRCLFVGSRGQHNVHGLSWFLAQVWPLILAACPAATLHVCGSVVEGIQSRPAAVVFRRSVADLTSVYSQAQVCLAPLLIGSGLKIKVIEALAYGRASVATGRSLEGIRMLADQAVLVADTPADFAAAVVRVLVDTDLRAELEGQARLLAETHFSPQQCYQPFVERVVACRSKMALAGQPS
jgi:glycosyltransferase involved in cell wall biosynthesis